MIKSHQNTNKLIFFDIGGTLGDGPDMFNYIAKKYKDSRTEEIAKKLSCSFGELYSDKDEEKFLSVTQMIELSLGKVSLELGVEDLSPFSHEYYKEVYYERAYLYTDTIEVLHCLKERGAKLIVISDADSDISIPQLRKLGIYDFFHAFIISSDMKSYKPSKRIVSEALKYCDVPNSDIFIVGDSIVDILSGNKMGINTILINRENKKIEVKCDYIIKSLSELLSIIR